MKINYVALFFILSGQTFCMEAPHPMEIDSQTIQALVAQKQSPLEKKLPLDAQILILSFLANPEGTSKVARFHIAVENIRMAMYKGFRGLFYSAQANGALIKLLAASYRVNRVEAATALATPGAEKWLFDEEDRLKKLDEATKTKYIDQLENQIENAIEDAGIQGNATGLNFLMKLGPNLNSNPCIKAIERGHIQLVEKMIEEWSFLVNSPAYNTIPLNAAVNSGNLPMVELLLTKNAEVNPGEIDQPLYLAAFCGHDQIVRRLLAADATINARSKYQRTALIAACERGHEAVVDILLAHGANPNLTDRNENTPLMRAAYWGRLAIAQKLLAAKAEINLTSSYDSTALDYAMGHGDYNLEKKEETIALLKKHGALTEKELKQQSYSVSNCAIQ